MAENGMVSLYITGEMRGHGKTEEKLSSSRWSSDAIWTAASPCRKSVER